MARYRSTRREFVQVGNLGYWVTIDASGKIVKAPREIRWAVGMDVADLRDELRNRALQLVTPEVVEIARLPDISAISPFIPSTSPDENPAVISLAKNIARYMASVYDDWFSKVHTKSWREQPWYLAQTTKIEEFVLGFMAHPNKDYAPILMAQQMLQISPLAEWFTNDNIHAYFKTFSEEVFKDQPEISYEELVETTTVAEIMQHEQLMGTSGAIRRTVELEAANYMDKSIATQQQIRAERDQTLRDLSDMIEDRYTELMSMRKTDAQNRRMETLGRDIENMLAGENPAYSDINKLIREYPELGERIERAAARIVHEVGGLPIDTDKIDRHRGLVIRQKTIERDESKEAEKSEAIRAMIKDMEYEGRIPTATTEGYDYRTFASGRQLNPAQIQDIYRGMTYAQHPPLPTRVKHPEFFDVEGALVARPTRASVEDARKGKKSGRLRKYLPSLDSFKVSVPDKRWGYKLIKGVLDVTVTVKGLRKEEFLSIPVLEKVFKQYGGDPNALKKAKTAMENGVKNLHAYIINEMMPTWVNMIHKETPEFQGMDSLRADRLGVFYEFVPEATEVKYKKRRGMSDAEITFKWARLTTSRALIGVKGGERTSRYGLAKGMTSRMTDIASARRSKGKRPYTRKLMGRYFGMMRNLIKESQGQSFIVQQYLGPDKRSGLESMKKSQLSSATTQEISALFGEEAGEIVRQSVKSGEPTTLALARHLRAQPGDRINMFLNDAGEVGVTVTKHVIQEIPGVKAVPPAVAVPGYKRIGTFRVPITKVHKIEPEVPVSDTFFQAIRAIQSSGWSGNFFQRLANILWTVDIPLPDYEVERNILEIENKRTPALRSQKLEQAVTRKIDENVATMRTQKGLEKRLETPMIDKVVTRVINSTSKEMQDMANSLFPDAITDAWIRGLTT